MDTKEVILEMNRPQNPISRGYASARELATYFTTHAQHIFKFWAASGKVTVYRFRDSKYYTFYSIEEILENCESDKLTDLGLAFDDRIVVERREKNRVDWDLLWRELKDTSGFTKVEQEEDDKVPMPQDRAPMQQFKPALKVHKAPRLEGTTFEMKPMMFTFDVAVETTDPEVISKIGDIYRQLCDLKERAEK